MHGLSWARKRTRGLMREQILESLVLILSVDGLLWDR